MYPCSSALVIGLTPLDRPCAIQLFRQDESSHFVRERPGRERDQELRATPDRIIEPECSTDQERNVLGTVAAVADPFREGLGGEGPAALVEGHDGARCSLEKARALEPL